MDPETDIPPDPGFAPLDFSPPLWVAVIAAGLLIRALPLWLVLGGLIKARRHPEGRRQHLTQTVAAGLVLILFTVEALAPGLVPQALRRAGAWSFVWVFAVAWTLLAWAQSLRAAQARPRWVEGVAVTLAALCGLSLGAVWLL